jgi:hypothetical protein
MVDEATVLGEAMDNLKEAARRIRATQSLMRSQGMTDGENHRDLLTRLSTALAMTSGTQEGQQTPGSVGCSKADEKEANIAYLSDEEQRQRVIEVVLREKGEDCPELVVVRARARLGGGLVDYQCKEGDPSDSLIAHTRRCQVYWHRHECSRPSGNWRLARVFTLNFVAWAFCELRLNGILRSSLSASNA